MSKETLENLDLELVALGGKEKPKSPPDPKPPVIESPGDSGKPSD